MPTQIAMNAHQSRDDRQHAEDDSGQGDTAVVGLAPAHPVAAENPRITATMPRMTPPATENDPSSPMIATTSAATPRPLRMTGGVG